MTLKWMSPDTDQLWLRESHMAGCPECDAFWDQWENGISLADAIEKVLSDPQALAELEVRRCPGCGHPLDWDVAIDAKNRTLSRTRQRRLFGTFRRLVREGRSASEIHAAITERYGVVAFYLAS